MAFLALPGCSSPTPAEALLACPKVSIVRDLAEVTQFRPGGSGEQDVVSRGALTDYIGNCDYTSKGVTVNLKLFLEAERGPAMQSSQATYRYFVALVRPGEETLSAKTEFETTITFSGMQNRAGSQEELTPKIPLPVDANAKDWNIFVGFQLSPEQLAFNRAQMARSSPRG